MYLHRKVKKRRETDDAIDSVYKKRIKRYKESLKHQISLATQDKILPGGLKIPGDTWNKLYK